MPIIQADVDGVLEQARAFYKGGGKTTNKVYLNIGDPDDIPPKRWDRNDEAEDEDNEIMNWEMSVPPGVDEGALIVNEGFRRGNCQLMSKVVRYYSERSAPLLNKRASLCTAEVLIRGLFSHVFVVVSDPHVRMFEYPTVARMANAHPPASGAWVIDCWANLACPAPEYGSRLRAKMDTWRAYGKVVLHEGRRHFENPDVRKSRRKAHFENPDLLAQYVVTSMVSYTFHR